MNPFIFGVGLFVVFEICRYFAPDKWYSVWGNLRCAVALATLNYFASNLFSIESNFFLDIVLSFSVILIVEGIIVNGLVPERYKNPQFYKDVATAYYVSWNRKK